MALKAAWRHVSHHYHEGGVRRVILKVAERVGAAVWSESSWLIYQIELSAYQKNPRLRLSRSDLNFDSLLRHGYFKAAAFPEVIQARLASGARCNGFYLGAELANIAWTTRNYLEIDIGLRLLEPNSVGIFDCLTLPPHRSKGFYTESLIQLALEARAIGVAKALIAVDPGNLPSIKGIERAGFTPLFQFWRRRRLGGMSTRRSGFRARFPASGNYR